MQDFAAAFYKSKTWQRCRNAYAKSVGGLCERCYAAGIIKPGAIVHHKTELTPDNIHDPGIALSWSNLELVCRDCHAAAHGSTRRYRVDDSGIVTLRGDNIPPG